MFTLSDFQSAIEQQFLHNQNKSLFYMLADGRTVLSPSKQSTTLFKQKSKEMGDFLQSAKSDGTFHLLLKPRLSFIEPLLSSNTSYIVEATVHSTKVKRVK